MNSINLRWLPLLAVTVGCAGQDAVDSGQPQVPSTAHWMADVFADRPDTPLGQILLPGAFNSTSYTCAAENGISPDSPDVVQALWGTDTTPDDDPNRQRVVEWAKTQDRSLAEQLEDGVRFLKLNVTLKDGVVTTWHSVYGVPLASVLDQVVDFAQAWPDEVVVLSFGVSMDSGDWPLFAADLVAPGAGGVSLCDLIYDGEEDIAVSSLADVRASGRNLVWAPSGELREWLEQRGDCPLSKGGVDRVWSITDHPEGVSEVLEASVDSRDPSRLLINDFAFSLDGADSVFAQAAYIGEYSGVQEASVELGFAGDFPGQLIDTHDVQGNMNIFAGAYYQDTNLVQAAMDANRGR